MCGRFLTLLHLFSFVDNNRTKLCSYRVALESNINHDAQKHAAANDLLKAAKTQKRAAFTPTHAINWSTSASVCAGSRFCPWRLCLRSATVSSRVDREGGG